MTTGDIYWAELPRANGHEQVGRRPVVILQDGRHGNNSPLVLVVPLTSATSTLRFAGTLLIEPTTENGLRQPSIALAFQLRAIDRTRVQDKIGTVSDDVIAAIFEQLDRLMGRRTQSD